MNTTDVSSSLSFILASHRSPRLRPRARWVPFPWYASTLCVLQQPSHESPRRLRRADHQRGAVSVGRIRDAGHSSSTTNERIPPQISPSPGISPANDKITQKITTRLLVAGAPTPHRLPARVTTRHSATASAVSSNFPRSAVCAGEHQTKYRDKDPEPPLPSLLFLLRLSNRVGDAPTRENQSQRRVD